MLRVTLALAVLSSALGCVKSAAFVCSVDGDCAPGSCEPDTHFCSFADGTCGSGRRYGEFAGNGLSSRCTGGPELDGRVMDGPASDGPASDGPTSDGPSTDVVVPPAGCGKTTLLSDAFDSTTRNPLWQPPFAATGASVTFNGSRIVFALPPSRASATSGLESRMEYDLSDSRLFLEVPQVPSAASAQTYVQLYGAGGAVFFQLEGGQLLFRKETGAGFTDIGTLTYDPVAHRWWQLRESAGTLYWETSPSGLAGTWVVRASVATPVPVTSLTVMLAAATTASEAAPGSAHFDNLNLENGVAPGGAYCPVASITDNFDAATRGPLWGGSYTSSGCVVTRSGGVVTMTPASGMAGSYCAYRTGRGYQLAGSAMLVKVPGMVGTTTGAEAYLEAGNPLNNDMMSINQEGGTLRFMRRVGGASSTISSVTYQPAMHLWWRLRESGGMVTAETSPNGSSWTAIGPAVASPIPTSVIAVELGAGTGDGTTSGAAQFDNFNLP